MKQLFLIPVLAFSAFTLLAADAPALDGSQNFSGKVLETTNAAGYTYVLVESGGQKVWAATTQFAVQPGDAVTVGQGALMPQYHSKTLNRDFDAVIFTGSISVGGGSNATVKLPPGHPSLATGTAKPNLDLTGIARAKGGQTVQEIVAGRAKWAGKTVTVRGKVVKFNGGIMGKNWLHIRDGSGSADNKDNDLTITTAAAAKVGDTVLVSGKVSVNQDFGAGYRYDVILQDADVAVE